MPRSQGQASAVCAAITQVYLTQKKLLGWWVEAAMERVATTLFLRKILALAPLGVKNQPLASWARFNFRSVAVFRLDGTPSRDSLEELEAKR